MIITKESHPELWDYFNQTIDDFFEELDEDEEDDEI